MSQNSLEKSEFMVNYSPTSSIALGANYLRIRDENFVFTNLSYLLARINDEDSQANFYISLGPGLIKDRNIYKYRKFAEIQADWESRKYYVEYTDMMIFNHRAAQNTASNLKIEERKLRLGLAPFKGEFDGLNVWLIAELEQKVESNLIGMTQFLRFYFKNTLWEIGADRDGVFNLNYMINL